MTDEDQETRQERLEEEPAARHLNAYHDDLKDLIKALTILVRCATFMFP